MSKLQMRSAKVLRIFFIRFQSLNIFLTSASGHPEMQREETYLSNISYIFLSQSEAGGKQEKETSSKVLIKVAIIPHTYEVTNFRFLQPGSKVNLEFDMIGKFVVRKLEGLKLSK